MTKKESVNEFTKKEISFLKSLNTPEKVQEFLDEIQYHRGRRLSIAEVFRKKTGDCIECACLASYILRLNKIDSFLIDLYCFNDSDHVICVYKKNGYYGSVAHSFYVGLRNKSPAYKTLRELVMSYFEHYFRLNGIFDLRKYSVPTRLPKKDGDWIFSKKFMYDFEVHIDSVKHISVLPNNFRVPKVSKAAFALEFIELPREAKVSKEYQDVIKNVPRKDYPR